jgi:large subunit ribosomal protein L22
MRLLADLVRGKAVTEALSILKYHKKVAYAGEMEKLLKSAVNNWEQRNEDMDINEVTLVVKTVMVDEGKTLKRIQPAPQGRAHRVRKRSNHITVVVSTSQVGNGQNPVNNQPNDDNN